MSDNIFADDWRDCLRAHYIDVVRADDQTTLRTLTGVLMEVGFGEAELRELYIQATLRADDLPEVFVPQPPPAPEAPPPASEAPPVEAATELEPEDSSDEDEPPPPPDNAPVQYSLF